MAKWYTKEGLGFALFWVLVSVILVLMDGSHPGHLHELECIRDEPLFSSECSSIASVTHLLVFQSLSLLFVIFSRWIWIPYKFPVPFQYQHGVLDNSSWNKLPDFWTWGNKRQNIITALTHWGENISWQEGSDIIAHLRHDENDSWLLIRTDFSVKMSKLLMRSTTLIPFLVAYSNKMKALKLIACSDLHSMHLSLDKNKMKKKKKYKSVR